MTLMSGAEAVASGLVKMGTRHVYGEIGTSILGFFDGLYGVQDKIRYISCRHEQVAASMADVEGRLTGRPGVAVVHSGPGALNALISVGNAMKDSSPMFLITGAVKSRLAGTDGMLEAAHLDIFRTLTKGVFRLSSVKEIPQVLSQAFQVAVSGAPGPVMIEVPEDIWKERDEVDESAFFFEKKPHEVPQKNDLAEIATALRSSKRPLILVGVGAKNSGQSITQLAESINVPLATTGNGRGVVNETHELVLGRVGFGGGTLCADAAFMKADVILCLGCGISDMVTYEFSQVPEGDVYMINLDPAASSKPVYVAKHVLADVNQAIPMLSEALSGYRSNGWDSEYQESRQMWQAALQAAISHFGPSAVMSLLNERLPADAVVCGGAGLHVVYANDFLKSKRPNGFLSSVNFGAMGFALPAAMSAALHANTKSVYAVMGDGEFLTTVQDLETVAREKMPVKILIVNDNAYRVLEIKQRMNYQGRVIGTRHQNPDFIKLADSFGIAAVKLTADKWHEQLLAALAIEGPVVIEIPTDPDDLPPTNVEAALKMGMA